MTNAFPEILKNLRKKNKHTQEDLANLLQVRKTTISNYETGYSTPDSKTLIKLSEIYNVSLDDLLGQKVITAKSPKFTQDNHAYKPVCKIMVIDDLIDIDRKDNRNVIYCISIPSTNYNDNAEYLGIKIEGDVLNKARLHDGDVAIIRLQDNVQNGDIAVVCVNEKDYYIRKFYKDDNDVIMLLTDSYNKKCNPVLINSNNDKYRILGKVVNAIINF